MALKDFTLSNARQFYLQPLRSERVNDGNLPLINFFATKSSVVRYTVKNNWLGEFLLEEKPTAVSLQHFRMFRTYKQASL